jgi:hypothetical protein
MMQTGSTHRWVALLLLAAVSALLNFTALRETRHGDLIIADGAKYVAYAYNLKHHGTFSHTPSYGGASGTAVSPDKLTLPGYPWFLARFLGDGAPDAAFVQRVQVAQACLNVVSTLLVFLIALRLMPLGWALAAGLLAASVPHVIVIAGYPLTEALSTTLVLGFVLATLHAASPQGTRWQAALAGLLLGALCLVRPQLQGIPWLVLLAVIFVPKWRPHLKRAAIAAAMFAALVLPWQLRNAQVERAPGDPDLLVVSVYNGSFPNFMYRGIPETRGYAYSFDPWYDDRVRDLPAALSYIGGLFAEQPARYIRWYLLGKPGAFLSWDFVEGRGGIFMYPATESPWLANPLFVALRNLHAWLHWPLMGAAMLTVFLALWRPEWIVRDGARRTDVRLLAALIGYIIVLHMLGYPLPRYNLPYRSLEFMMALVGLRALGRARRAKARPAQD